MQSKRVFHFSGGRTSALMTLRYYQAGDLVIFCDTGRETEETYRFIRDFEARTGIPIIWLDGNFQQEVILKEQCIPNHWRRKCTINLKIRKARRYLRSLGWFDYIQFIGFRHDEQTRITGYQHRWKAVETRFPLDEDKTTKSDVLAFWLPVSWNLNQPEIMGNCDLCFNKGEGAIMAILQHEPWRADKWIDDEENKEINPNGYTYFKTPIRVLRDNALKLKVKYDLNEISSKFKCSCTA